MNSRNQSLDVLRGVAILLVLGRHFRYFELWRQVGGYGVDLFFVLSGFLISGLLFTEYKRTGAINYWRFIIRRGLKIWPSYYLLIAVMTLLTFLLAKVHGVRFDPQEMVVSAVFLRNYFPSAGFNLITLAWSLAVEEHFYLLLPLLLIGLIRFRSREPFRPLCMIFIAVALISVVLRRFFPQPGVAIPYATHLRMDALFAGVVLGYGYHFHRAFFDCWLSRPWMLAIAAVFLSPLFLVPEASRFMGSFGVTTTMLGFSALTAWVVNHNLKGRFFSAIARIGVYSYSIYLWHACFYHFTVGAFPHSLLAFVVGVAGALAMGYVMSQLVEFPVLRWRDRIFPSTKQRSAGRAPQIPTKTPVLEPAI